MEAHGPAGLRAAYVITGNLTDAEDVLQDSLIRAHRKLAGFEGRSSFKTWLLRIVTNQALNHVRARGRRQRAELRAVRPEPKQEGDILDSLASLPDADRAVLACRYFLDLTQEESAEVLGLPVGTVKSRQAAALARLRALMREEVLDDR
jgi:RNA polymerase sigma-70 factor (ECF subfamily)